MEERTIHWDKFPKGTGFAVSEFKEEPHREQYGILASLPDGRFVWVALGSPPELVFAPNRKMAQSILNNLREFSKMKQASEEIGEWGDEDSSGLPDPRSLPTVNWDRVPSSARLHERQFRGKIWGIIADLPDGEHLVFFDRFFRNTGYHEFSASQEEARKVVAFLELSQTPPDPEPQGAERTAVKVHTPPFVPDSVPAEELGVKASQIAADLEEIEYIEMGWLFRLYYGKRQSCICSQCRHEYVYRLDQLVESYLRQFKNVPTEIRTAINFVLKSWEVVENNRQA